MHWKSALLLGLLPLTAALAEEKAKGRAKPGRFDLSHFATGRYKNHLVDSAPPSAAPVQHHD
jgi:hypothetical protein